MDVDRIRFLFESDVAPVDVDDELIAWFDEQLDVDPDGGPRGALHTVIADQILQDNPPEAWTTAQRLQDEGLTTDRILNQMVLAFGSHLSMVLSQASTDSPPKANPDKMRAEVAAAYSELPLPETAAMESLLLELMVKSGHGAADEIFDQALKHLGFDALNDTIEPMLENVLDELTDRGELMYTAGDRVAHVPTLCTRLALTHVINDMELDLGVLSLVDSDLNGFGHLEAPHLADGGAPEVFSVESDHLAWGGPEGWLDRFEAGDTLLVRSNESQIDIEVVDPPAARPDLVERISNCHQRSTSDYALPLAFNEILVALLVEDPNTFSGPAPPLTKMCEAAGLEVQSGLVARSEEAWWNLARARRYDRVHSLPKTANWPSKASTSWKSSRTTTPTATSCAPTWPTSTPRHVSRPTRAKRS